MTFALYLSRVRGTGRFCSCRPLATDTTVSLLEGAECAWALLPHPQTLAHLCHRGGSHISVTAFSLLSKTQWKPVEKSWQEDGDCPVGGSQGFCTVGSRSAFDDSLQLLGWSSQLLWLPSPKEKQVSCPFLPQRSLSLWNSFHLVGCCGCKITGTSGL